MSGKVFENYQALQAENLPKYAAEAGLDVASFSECLASDRFDEKINREKAEAQRAGVASTPNFLIGYTRAGSTKFKAAELIRGAFPYDTFAQTIDKLIKAQPEPKDPTAGD